MNDFEKSLKIISAQIRKGIFETIKEAKSGHLGGSSSSTELMTTLYFNQLNFDPKNSKNPERDRVLVRGHLGPLRYNLFSLIGWVEKNELDGYRSLNSRLEGHETMEIPGVDITPSGSLGMLLSYGTGAAIAAKRTNKNFLTYVFLGDGEEQEGNVSEAARHASSRKLENLVCIMDKNGKQLSRPTNEGDSSSNVKKIWEGYGWNVDEIKDGHSFKEILNKYDLINYNKNRPLLLIADTIKGKGLEGSEENCCGYHTLSSCPSEVLDRGIENQNKIIKDYGRDPLKEAKYLLRRKNGKR